MTSSGIGGYSKSTVSNKNLSQSEAISKNQSDLQKTYLMQNNTRLAEDLKIVQKKLMLFKGTLYIIENMYVFMFIFLFHD